MSPVPKVILVGIVSLAAAISVYAQSVAPVPIPQYIKKVMSHQWYVEQADAWEQHVRKSPADAAAWWNFYKALRYSNFDSEADAAHKARTKERVRKLEQDIALNIPGTFEYHHILWAAGGFDLSRLDHLMQAERLRPNDPELASNMISYYETQLDRERVKEFSGRWYKTQDFSTGLLEYNYNVLMSLAPNAVLFTSGDLDTYPVWMLQYLKSTRPDVTVLNSGLLSLPSYRTAVLKQAGLQGDTSCPDRSCLPTFYKNICERNPQRPIYFALTFGTHHLDLIKEDLYAVGLAYKYSPTRIDNIALLEKNWKKFHLDYLDLMYFNESNEFNDGRLQSMNMNYITPAVVLYEHYMLAGDLTKANEMRDLIIRLAREGAQEKEVVLYLDSLDRSHASENTTTTSTDSPSSVNDGWQVIRAEYPKGLLNDGTLSVFPNPAVNTLNLKMQFAVDAQVAIIDANGRTVRLTNMSGTDMQLKIDELPAGSYVVRVWNRSLDLTRTVQIVR